MCFSLVIDGYIDKTGRLVIKHNTGGSSEGLGRFSAGLAAVRFGNKFGYMDKKGNVVIKPKFDFALDFSQELAAVRIGNKWGYISR